MQTMFHVLGAYPVILESVFELIATRIETSSTEINGVAHIWFWLGFYIWPRFL
jgi:hypothetical protein